MIFGDYYNRFQTPKCPVTLDFSEFYTIIVMLIQVWCRKIIRRKYKCPKSYQSLLAVMLTAAMIVVAAISVSADTDDEGSYVPSEGTETYHIYFCKPDDWENKYTSDAGVYWENGSDTPSAW